MFQTLTVLILISLVTGSLIVFPNALAQTASDLKIVSFSQYVDSIDILHVVGEVENNSPSIASFVQVVGTFYDGNNKVVGTSLTYTTPADISPGSNNFGESPDQSFDLDTLVTIKAIFPSRTFHSQSILSPSFSFHCLTILIGIVLQFLILSGLDAAIWSGNEMKCNYCSWSCIGMDLVYNIYNVN